MSSARPQRTVVFLPHHFREPGEKGGLRSWHIVNQLGRYASVTVIVPGVDTLTGERAQGLSSHQLWAEEPRDDNVRLIRVNSLRNDRSSKVRRALYYLSFSILQFVRALSLRRMDAIVTTSLPVSTMLGAWMVAKLRRAPLVVDVRDLPTDLAIELRYFRDNSFSRMLRRLEYFVYKRAKLVICVSHGMRAMLIERGVTASKVEVVPIGYDALEADQRAKSGTLRDLELGDRFVVLYSGTMGYVVDIETVLDAARLLAHRRDILFLLVGDGQRLEEYKTRSRQDGSRCVFTGRVRKSEVAEICERADVCVYPLVSGRIIATLLGNKIFDYMGAGKPTVYCGPVGDVSKLIEDSNCGICLPPGDAAGLAEAVVDLQQNPDKARRLGEAGRRYVLDGWTAPQTTARLASLVVQLTG